MADLESTVTDLAPSLLRFCVGLTRSAEEGEELAQESLAALVRHWRKNGPPESAAAFAYTVARRQAMRLGRRLKRLLPLDILDSRPHPAPALEVLSIHRQRLQEAVRALGLLTARDREAILLAMDEELNVDEAAAILGISGSAFKMRVHRARQRLSVHLENCHETRETERVEARAPL